MPSCAMGHCKNYTPVTKGKGISYHRFPRDLKLRKLWIQKCRRSDKLNPNTSNVCSDHFHPDDYIRDLQAELLGCTPRKMLKSTAVPETQPPPDLSVPLTTARRPGSKLLIRKLRRPLAKQKAKSGAGDDAKFPKPKPNRKSSSPELAPPFKLVTNQLSVVESNNNDIRKLPLKNMLTSRAEAVLNTDVIDTSYVCSDDVSLVGQDSSLEFSLKTSNDRELKSNSDTFVVSSEPVTMVPHKIGSNCLVHNSLPLVLNTNDSNLSSCASLDDKSLVGLTSSLEFLSPSSKDSELKSNADTVIASSEPVTIAPSKIVNSNPVNKILPFVCDTNGYDSSCTSSNGKSLVGVTSSSEFLSYSNDVPNDIKPSHSELLSITDTVIASSGPVTIAPSKIVNSNPVNKILPYICDANGYDSSCTSSNDKSFVMISNDVANDIKPSHSELLSYADTFVASSEPVVSFPSRIMNNNPVHNSKPFVFNTKDSDTSHTHSNDKSLTEPGSSLQLLSKNSKDSELQSNANIVIESSEPCPKVPLIERYNNVHQRVNKTNGNRRNVPLSLDVPMMDPEVEEIDSSLNSRAHGIFVKSANSSIKKVSKKTNQCEVFEHRTLEELMSQYRRKKHKCVQTVPPEEYDTSSPESRLEWLEHKVQTLKTSVTNRDSKIRKLQYMVRNAKREAKNSVKEEANNLVHQILGKLFNANQIDCLITGKRCMNWNEEILAKSWALRNVSKKAYVYLRKQMGYPFPGVSTLKRWNKYCLRKKQQAPPTVISDTNSNLANERTVAEIN